MDGMKWASALVLALASGCVGGLSDTGGTPDATAVAGTEGAPCYPNGTCNAGLECSAESVCIAAVVDGVGEFLAAAEERGKPTLEATDPVTELVIVDDVVGTGEAVKPGDTVTVHYVGAAATTGEEFDSSWSRGEPISFGLDQVIAGWGTGLVGMKEGGRRTLIIPADQAYGNGGPAPGDSLVFTVDLISIDS